VEFEKWICILDQKREDTAHCDPSKRWQERPREIPVNQQLSDFTALPEGMLIDYFDLDFYNGLQPQLRNSITNTKIAVLPDLDHSLLLGADEKLSNEQFNAKYGAGILARYRLVEEGELKAIDKEAEWLADDHEDVGMPSDDDTSDISNDVDMSARQRSLATQLLVGSIKSYMFQPI
jgi:hypothetical protein